jgi:putative membrane protein
MRRLSYLATGTGGTALGTAAHAHGLPGAFPSGWTWDLWITAPLAVVGLCFIAGWLKLLARSRLGRDAVRRRGLWFAAGWVVLAAALVSPLHQAGERSFAAHMLEHELLMLVAAPLLVLSRPLAILLWGLPARLRLGWAVAANFGPVRRTWQVTTHAVTATLLQAAALWGWHAPALFDLALTNRGWHVIQHLSFLVTALLFWTAMLRGVGEPATHEHRGIRSGVAALCLFLASLVSGALGALMAFSQSPWYRGYADLGMAPFGLTPGEDQQVAGLLMWIPGGLIHAGAALAVIATVLKTMPYEPEARHAR